MNELTTTNYQEMFLPVMNLEVALQRREYLVKFVKSIMREGQDFGKIPGAGDKPTLLKPGAEKLATFFGLTPVFIPVSVTEDWTGADFGGEPFFNYRYKCELWRAGNLIATAEASCNSHESKYRYRKGERVCPQCGATAIRKAKEEDRGYYCWRKIEGCGATFPNGDKRIESQEVGRILNPDVADQVNTMQKMSQKRALVASILLAVNASEFFTQDIEDLTDHTVDSTATVVAPQADKKPTSNGHKPAPAQHRQAETPPPAEPDFYIDPTNGEMTTTPPEPTAADNGRCPECNSPNGKPHGTKCSRRKQSTPAGEPVPA